MATIPQYIIASTKKVKSVDFKGLVISWGNALPIVVTEKQLEKIKKDKENWEHLGNNFFKFLGKQAPKQI